MTSEVRELLDSLGLKSYLPRFLQTGFDDWEALSNILESDLALLGIPLGHRRKLQREIARRHLWPDSEHLPSTVELQRHEDRLIAEILRLAAYGCPEKHCFGSTYTATTPSHFSTTPVSEHKCAHPSISACAEELLKGIKRLTANLLSSESSFSHAVSIPLASQGRTVGLRLCYKNMLTLYSFRQIICSTRDQIFTNCMKKHLTIILIMARFC